MNEIQLRQTVWTICHLTELEEREDGDLKQGRATPLTNQKPKLQRVSRKTELKDLSSLQTNCRTRATIARERGLQTLCRV